MTWLPTRRTNYCRATLQVGDKDVVVEAFGEAADVLSGILAGRAVAVEVLFGQHTTKQPGGTTRVRTELRATQARDATPCPTTIS